MVALNDQLLLTIFKQLRLDHRTSLRLSSKRFNKLVIFHQNEPRTGKLKYIEQTYASKLWWLTVSVVTTTLNRSKLATDLSS